MGCHLEHIWAFRTSTFYSESFGTSLCELTLRDELVCLATHIPLQYSTATQSNLWRLLLRSGVHAAFKSALLRAQHWISFQPDVERGCTETSMVSEFTRYA